MLPRAWLTWIVCTAAVLPVDSEVTEIIEGVPVYNYDLARLARVGQQPKNDVALLQMMEGGPNHPQPDDEIEWLVVMKDGVTDKQVDNLCHDKNAHKCLSEGHPDEHGVPITGITTNIKDLRKLLRSHPGEVKAVEPNLPIFIPKLEDHFGKDAKKGEALIEYLDEGFYYVMRHIADDFVTGQQYSSLSGAKNRFDAVSKDGNPTMVADSNYNEVAYAGARSRTIKHDFVNWWSQHTGKKPNPSKPTPAPAPAPGPLQPKSDKPKPTQSPKAPAQPQATRRRRSIAPLAEWNLDRIDDRKGLDHSYSFPYDGYGVHVYVLDTGININHEDFKNDDGSSRVIPTIEMWGTEVNECSGPGDTTCAVDRMGHGTHCAGTVGGERSGVAKGATIHGVKVLSDEGAGSDLGVVMAIDWIMSKGARPAVLSMSLGRRGKSEALANALNKAMDDGISVVVAAGNENLDACGNSPAYVPRVITVGATAHDDSRADFSNYGSCVDIFAPGKDIRSAYYAGAARFLPMSGTSMACPAVAGVVAQILQTNPNMKPDDVAKLVIKEGTKDVMQGAGQRSPDLLLYVNPNPEWNKKSGAKTPRSAGAGKAAGTTRRRSSKRRRRGKGGTRRRRKGGSTAPSNSTKSASKASKSRRRGTKRRRR